MCRQRNGAQAGLWLVGTPPQATLVLFCQCRQRAPLTQAVCDHVCAGHLAPCRPARVSYRQHRHGVRLAAQRGRARGVGGRQA